MGTFTTFLGQQPLLALFMVVAAGHAIGAINLKGFSLGVGAVLFSGLFVGAIAPKSQPPAMVGTLGLVMFLYGLGVQFGKQFFDGLTGATGRRYNLLMVLALAGAAAISVVEMMMMKIAPSMMAGLFAGAGTNAATMQAALEAAGNNDPAVGYGVAFPFGLVGAILCMYVMQLVVRPNVEASMRAGVPMMEVAISSPEVVGRTLGAVMARLPEGVQVVLVRSHEENRHPEPAMVLGANDVLLLRGNDEASLAAAQHMLGEQATGRVVGDRSKIDYLRVFVSRPALEGTPLAELKMPAGIDARITQVRRGDSEMLISPELTLEIGDRVGILADRTAFPALQKFFGNSIRGTSEFSYVSLGIGMVLGVLLGTAPIPVPGLGTMKLGVAGGALIAALVLGKLGRTWRLTWTMPLAANLTLRNFGLALFLAQVGMSSGTPFVNVVRDSGLVFLVAGALIVLALALVPLLVGQYLMRIPFDDVLGITAGVTGTPAILAYAYRSFPSDRVEICYAMIYPAATIVKIVIAQLLIAASRGG